MKVLSTDEIKKLELNMLIEFDQLCKKKNLSYVLCGGTLLGAIRHKGFIPWDDDIDVMMPRPDFNRLCKMMKRGEVELPSHMKAISWFTNPKMDIPLIKIIDLRTTVEEKYMDADKHLWIDIIPIDGCPESEETLVKMFKTTRMLRNLLFAKQTRKGQGTTKSKAIRKDILRVFLKPISAKFLCKRLDKVASKYDIRKATTAGCIMWGYGPQERVNKTGWLTTIEVEFEGHSFFGPSNYDEYLGNLYGDYMKLPPLEKRTSHEMIVCM